MNNYKVFEYLGITQQHAKGNLGEGVHIGVWDSETRNHIDMVCDIIFQIAPRAKITRYVFNGDVEGQMKQMIEDRIDILNISMIGIEFEHEINNRATFPTYRELKQRVIIFASMGNTGKRQIFYPSGYDDCYGVSACADYGDNLVIPKVVGLSTYGDHTAFCGFTNLWFTNPINYTHRFSGTSCSCPQVTALTALMINMFKKRFNKNPDRYDVLLNLKSLCIDINIEGFDIKSGFGVPCLSFVEPKLIDYVYWSSMCETVDIEFFKQYVLDKYNK